MPTGKQKANGSSVRLPVHSVALLGKLVQEANRKDFGRRISAGEIVAEALTLLKERHIGDLQEASRTQEEKFSALYERFRRTEAISRERFFDKLMNGDIPKGVLKSLQAERELDPATVDGSPENRVDRKEG